MRAREQWVNAFKLPDRGGEGASHRDDQSRAASSRARGDQDDPRSGMRPENLLDWIAFALLILGAFAWGYYATQTNILTVVLSRIWEPLDDLVFVLIAASGVYWLRRVFPRQDRRVRDGERPRWE